MGWKPWSGLSWISENVKGGKKGKSLSFPLEEGGESKDEDSISEVSSCSMLSTDGLRWRYLLGDDRLKEDGLKAVDGDELA